MHPPSVFPIDHHASVLEHFEMKRQPGLGGVERVLQLAHASLAILEHVHDRQARFVGKRMKELGGSTDIRSGRGHNINISRFID